MALFLAQMAWAGFNSTSSCVTYKACSDLLESESNGTLGKMDKSKVMKNALDFCSSDSTYKVEHVGVVDASTYLKFRLIKGDRKSPIFFVNCDGLQQSFECASCENSKTLANTVEELRGVIKMICGYDQYVNEANQCSPKCPGQVYRESDDGEGKCMTCNEAHPDAGRPLHPVGNLCEDDDHCSPDSRRECPQELSYCLCLYKCLQGFERRGIACVPRDRAGECRRCEMLSKEVEKWKQYSPQDFPEAFGTCSPEDLAKGLNLSRARLLLSIRYNQKACRDGDNPGRCDLNDAQIPDKIVGCNTGGARKPKGKPYDDYLKRLPQN